MYGSYSAAATNTPTVSGILYHFLSGTGGAGDGGQFWQDYVTNNLYLRQRWGGTYGSWLTILSASNYNSYAPTLTGTGASGSWGISVTGSATAAAYVQGSFNRTDATAYPVCWVANQGTQGGVSTATLAFSCAAVTITSSTGQLSATILTSTSDARVKTNVKVIDNAISKLVQLRGVTYDRTDVDIPRQTGVIAQEVLKVLPEAVTGSEDTQYSVAYGNMIGLMIEAIKEQQTIIDSQESRIARLETLVSKLIEE
jgi:hypothetical protein